MVLGLTLSSETGVKVITFQGCPQVHKPEHPEEQLEEEVRAPGQSPSAGFTVAKPASQS